MRQFVVSIILALAAGCSSVVPVPELAAKASGDPLEAWAKVLARHVDERGRVNFGAVAKDPSNLELYVRYVASHGPKSTPQEFAKPEVTLAHYLNSYNALAMYNVLLSEIPETLSGLIRKAKFFYFKKFIVDGEEISLYDYENDVIRKTGEERVHFALNCMSVGCPRLPKMPFAGDKLESQLQTAAAEFMAESRNVEVDEKEKLLRLSEIFKFFTEDFLKKAPSLNAYVNRYRAPKHQVPLDYDVDFLSYDWTVSRAP